MEDILSCVCCWGIYLLILFFFQKQMKENGECCHVYSSRCVLRHTHTDKKLTNIFALFLFWKSFVCCKLRGEERKNYFSSFFVFLEPVLDSVVAVPGWLAGQYITRGWL